MCVSDVAMCWHQEHSECLIEASHTDPDVYIHPRPRCEPKVTIPLEPLMRRMLDDPSLSAIGVRFVVRFCNQHCSLLCSALLCSVLFCSVLLVHLLQPALLSVVLNFALCRVFTLFCSILCVRRTYKQRHDCNSTALSAACYPSALVCSAHVVARVVKSRGDVIGSLFVHL